MDAPTHFHDVTNLAASPRNSAAHHQEAIMSSRSAQSEAAQQSHTTITPDASYDDGSQHMLMKQNQADLATFGTPIPGGTLGPKEADGCNAAASNDGSRIHNVDASGHSRQLDMSAPLRQTNAQFHDPHAPSLEQEIGAALHTQVGNVQQSPATHGHFFSSTDGQRDAQMAQDQSHPDPMQFKTEPASFADQHHQVKSYPPSPPRRNQMIPQPDSRSFQAGVRSTEGRHMISHRPSHSLGQAGAFMSGISDRDMFGHSHVSAPVSPSDGMNSGPFAALFQYPGARQEVGPGMTEHGHVLDQSVGPGISRPIGHLPKSCAPSVRSASPSTSMASTSMASISPLGSARINADGSFTSQETSFDSISNAASGSFSRASSTSEEAFFQDLGSLGLASSLRMNKQKKKLRNIDRKEICDYSIANPLVKQDAIANRFGIERSTVSKILKHKEKWLAIDPQSDAAHIAKHRAVKFPAVEDRLTSWVAALKASGKPVRDSIIRQEALRIARELGLGEDKFKASGGWIEKFRERNMIPKPQLSDAASATSATGADATELDASSCDGASSHPTASAETSTEASIMPTGGPAEAESSTGGQSRSVRRQPARASKAKGTPQKRTRDDAERTQAILSMSPLSHDLARMHFPNGAPIPLMPESAFFRPNVYETHPAASQFMTNNNIMYGGHYVSPTMQPMEDQDESERKRRRSGQHFDAGQASMVLDAPIEFQLPSAGASALSPLDGMPGAAPDGQGQSDVGLQTASPRSRRTVAKSTTANGGRGRARRGKGRLSGANHTPQTPSPLSMSPTDARSEAVLPRFNLADAEQITAATLERIRALQSSGDKSSIVTAEQAQQSLELVLRFLSEQPSDFLPANHFVVFGHLQANIEQKIRDQAKQSPAAADGPSSQPPVPGASPNAEATSATLGDDVNNLPASCA